MKLWPMNMPLISVSKKNLEIITEYQEIPKTAEQKTKLFFVLTSLFKNAIQAMSQVEKKTLAISISRTEDADQLHQSIFIKVNDNGSGIKADNLEKVFRHGFSQTKGSYGFELHNCANYIQDMGGKIWVESEGEGKGATFVLEFPQK